LNYSLETYILLGQGCIDVVDESVSYEAFVSDDTIKRYCRNQNLLTGVISVEVIKVAEEIFSAV
jgi:hypothetical protein